MLTLIIITNNDNSRSVEILGGDVMVVIVW